MGTETTRSFSVITGVNNRPVNESPSSEVYQPRISGAVKE